MIRGLKHMKVCIVTVYDSINCGSYWQAKALGIKLKQMGIDVTYLKRKNDSNSSSSRKKQFRIFASYCKHQKISSALRYGLSLRDFSYLHKKTNVTENTMEFDCFVLGSDTIWNLNEEYFRTHSNTYWGVDFFPCKVISYAASAANTTAKQIAPELHDAIGKMYAVSVRDKHTYDLVCNDNTREVQIVCDPTLLLKKEEYLRYMLNNHEHEGFVFLYLSENLSVEQSMELRSFCKEKGLKIINGFGFEKPDYCDKSIIMEPRRFLTYMYFAEYIITDTFHGTVFSVCFNKLFVSLDRGKRKVNDFLENIGLKERMIDNESNIIERMILPYDYSHISLIVDKMRNDSIAYLRNSLIEQK